MANKKIILLILILLLLAGAVVYWEKGNKKKVDLSGFTPPKVQSVGKSGEITPGFSKDLILKTGKVYDSFTLDYSDGTQQKTVSFTSSEKPVDILSQYIKYFTDNEYSLNGSSFSKTAGSLFARKDKTQVSVAVSTDAGGRVIVRVDSKELK